MGYGHLGSPMPSRRIVAGAPPTGVEPAISRLTTGRACHQLRGGVAREWPRWESNPQTPASEAGGFAGLPTGPSGVPGAGIEPAASWVRARRHYQQQLPRNRSALGHILTSRGSGRRIRTSTACSKGKRPAVSRSPSRECPAGVEPACPAWEAGASAARPRALNRGGRRGSRTPKAHRSPVFETGAVANRLALPFRQHRGEESNLRLDG